MTDPRTRLGVRDADFCRRRTRHIGFGLALVALAACGGGSGPDMDAGVDANTMTDSGSDATTPDASSDASVDAAPDPCSTEGETRVADCGRCGTRSERCEGGVWIGASECLGQGECAVAAVDEQTTAMCVTQQRLCDATCSWGAWEDVTTGGECQPGEVQVVPRTGCTNQIVERCADTCSWEPQYAEGCGPCGAPPRTDLDLLCIPTNDVLLNRTTDPTSETFPATVSYFWIMRYPANVGMLQDCIADGACSGAPPSGMRDVVVDAPADAAEALGVQDELCAWLGGRSPRLAEWVLAARGPAPRSARYPWWNGLTGPSGNDVRSCETVPLQVDADLCPTRYPLWQEVTSDGLPWTRSYFGLEAMIGTQLAEVVSDAFQPTLGDAYDRRATPGLHDPTGPGSPTGTLIGGGLKDEIGITWRSLDDTFGGAIRTVSFSQLRCAFEVTP